ncbi:MAG: Clp protease ClpP [Sphaerochaetaceae bacterium]|nr:Clp protease ClpP [Sphaerochaetaceae bacterium]
MKFWNWKNEVGPDGSEKPGILELNGVIAEDSWFDDEITPELFKKELNAQKGDIEVWINSPGGDCIAASRMYTMLSEYGKNHKVTVKIDGLAASAATVVAMAGHEVLMAPLAMMMIHNPSTMTYGDVKEHEKSIEILESFKEGIMSAYMIKTGRSKKELSEWMDKEDWMSSGMCIERGFADGLIEPNLHFTNEAKDFSFSEKNSQQRLL